jgi:tetratricopeptide (TPR) repeat protein
MHFPNSLVPVIAVLTLAGCGNPAAPGSPNQRAQAGTHTPTPGKDTDSGEMKMSHLPTTLADWSRGARLYAGLGGFHRPITTDSKDAQTYFDQGMRLMWAFNHDEASRSFAKAAELDPQCAMCFWGVALTVGPNYNLPMMAAPRAKVAWAALEDAQKHSAHATAVEQALIEALAARYPNADPLDPATQIPVLTAYAAAMKQVSERFPDDLDVQTMYAESMMNIRAWKLWTLDGKPAPDTEKIVATLESVLQRDPHHPGANHYYIHAIEASPHPEKGVTAAETLRGMMPSAGHLEHMPAHIMQRVGRYEEAAEANRRGATADQKYLADTQPIDYYGMYVGHNYQFLAYSAAMEGRKAETLDAVAKSREAVPDKMLVEMPGADWYVAEYYLARVRFGLWQQILAEPAPNPQLPGLVGAYYYSRGCALAATGRVPEAKAALGELEKVAASTSANYSAGGSNLGKDVLSLATHVLKARIAGAEHDGDTQLSVLRRAVREEDSLSYDEPPAWFIPVRHMLGAALLEAGKASEAEAVYREDLQKNPNNGWALYGLARALQAQMKSSEAARVQREFKSAWSRADVVLSASAL